MIAEIISCFNEYFQEFINQNVGYLFFLKFDLNLYQYIFHIITFSLKNILLVLKVIIFNFNS